MKPVLKRLDMKTLQKIYKDSISTEVLNCNVRLAINSLIDYLSKEDDYDHLAKAIERIIVVDTIHSNLEKEAKKCMKEYNKAMKTILQ
jgi:hypothetical protein